MPLSHDIWHQIIQYFEHQEEDTDANEKRMVLFNMAVVSHLLSDLALATLWKNMDSLQPIVDVINSFTPAQESPLLTWVDDDDCNYWEFLRKPIGDQVDSRVKEYLGRIRLLRALGENESERALWTVLIAWFWKAEPLLPNLQKLVVFFEERFQAPYQYVGFMVPPKLKSISMVDIQSFGHVMTLYQLLFSQGCSPTSVEYGGDVRLPPTITLLENLDTLIVYGPYEHATHSSPFSLLELLKQLPSLRYLEIDLGTLQIEATDPLDPFEHLTLETLILEGTTEELQPLLSFAIICPLVKEFLLEIQFNTKLTWKSLLEKVIAILPNLKQVTLRVPEPAGTPRLVLSDLDQLLPQPIESLLVEGVPNKLSQKDLRQMLETWPKLHSLTLTGGEMPFNMENLLSMDTYRNLHTLHLPFDFIPLAAPLAHRPPPTQKNPLKNLCVAASTRFPSKFKKKIVLAVNLLTLLPDLETVSVGIDDEQLEVEATDLRDIIKGMQDAIAARSG